MDDQFNKNEIEKLKQLLRALNASSDGSSIAYPISPWWQDPDVRNFLGISQRSLERRRAEQKIKFHKIGSRCYYLPKDILEMKNG